MPQVTATAANGLAWSASSSPDNPGFDSNTRYKHPKVELDLLLTLFDFGLRSATASSARASLAAAYALRDDATREVFMQTAQSFYELQKAIETVKASLKMEASATQLRDAVDGRYKGGAASQTELLQSESSLSEMELKRVMAEGDAETAKGSLAILLNMDADTQYDIAVTESKVEVADFESVSEFIKAALLNDPKLGAAAASLRSSEADLAAARAKDLPTISLQATRDLVGQTYVGQNTFSVYQNPSSNTQHVNEVELQITVPLTNFATRAYRIQSAEATVQTKALDYESTKQQVTLAVWGAFQKLRVNTFAYESLTHSVEVATKLYNVVEGRYSAGAGSITDVLTAQRDLADARIKQVSAAFDLRVSRIALLANVGQIVPQDVD